MKDRILLLVALMASVALVAAGCGDDDGNDNAGGTGGTISGEGGTGGEIGEGGTGGEIGEGGTGGEIGEGGTGGEIGEGGTGGEIGEGGTGGEIGEGGTGGGEPSCDFEPCGGDPVGTWTAAGTCEMTTIDLSNDDPRCQGLELMATVSATGTLVYTATTETSTLTFDAWDEVFTIRGECLEMIGELWEEEDGVPYTDQEVCDEYDFFFSLYYNGSCVYSSADGCTCELDLSGPMTWSDVPYSVQGDNLVSPGEEDDIITPFCVEGSTMKQDWGTFILILEK